MYIDKNSLIINNVNMGKYVSQAEYGYNKLWGSDTGRNTLNGAMTGTFLGIVVKLKLSFIPTTQAELETISPILNTGFQTTQYYDPDLRRMNSIQTYTGDWATLNKNIFENVARANEPFDISVIATIPR